MVQASVSGFKHYLVLYSKICHSWLEIPASLSFFFLFFFLPCLSGLALSFISVVPILLNFWPGLLGLGPCPRVELRLVSFKGS